jgi:leader peptidase (prepilin peptidase)/N-methyltransferase
MTFVLVVSALLGAAIGSFLNVVIHRVPRAESLLRPGSHCVHCQTPVRAWQNVPIFGWLLLRGRCAGCAGRISVRYPLVEGGTAVLFVAITARIGLTPALPAYLYLGAAGVALALIDLDVRRLPDAIVLPSYLVGGVLLASAAAAGADWSRAGRALLAMAALFSLYFVLALVYPGGMGFGDVKLAGLLGLYLGWLGWSPVWIGTFAGFLLGSLVGVALMVTRRATGRTAIPFGPAMLAGALLALFVAEPVSAWYGSFLAPPL